MSNREEIKALSEYIMENWSSLTFPGPESERLQYLRTKILIKKNEKTS